MVLINKNISLKVHLNYEHFTFLKIQIVLQLNFRDFLFLFPKFSFPDFIIINFLTILILFFLAKIYQLIIKLISNYDDIRVFLLSTT